MRSRPLFIRPRARQLRWKKFTDITYIASRLDFPSVYAHGAISSYFTSLLSFGPVQRLLAVYVRPHGEFFHDALLGVPPDAFLVELRLETHFD